MKLTQINSGFGKGRRMWWWSRSSAFEKDEPLCLLRSTSLSSWSWSVRKSRRASKWRLWLKKSELRWFGKLTRTPLMGSYQTHHTGPREMIYIYLICLIWLTLVFKVTRDRIQLSSWWLRVLLNSLSLVVLRFKLTTFQSTELPLPCYFFNDYISWERLWIPQEELLVSVYVDRDVWTDRLSVMPPRSSNRTSGKKMNESDSDWNWENWFVCFCRLLTNHLISTEIQEKHFCPKPPVSVQISAAFLTFTATNVWRKYVACGLFLVGVYSCD